VRNQLPLNWSPQQLPVVQTLIAHFSWTVITKDLGNELAAGFYKVLTIRWPLRFQQLNSVAKQLKPLLRPSSPLSALIALSRMRKSNQISNEMNWEFRMYVTMAAAPNYRAAVSSVPRYRCTSSSTECKAKRIRRALVAVPRLDFATNEGHSSRRVPERFASSVHVHN